MSLVSSKFNHPSYKPLTPPLRLEIDSDTNKIASRSQFYSFSKSALKNQQNPEFPRFEKNFDSSPTARIGEKISRSRRFAAPKSLSSQLSIRSNQKLVGSLSSTDRTDSRRSGRLMDEFVLRGVLAGQRVTVDLKSSKFDSYLQVLNQATGRVITQNDDIGGNNHNSRLSFTAQAGVSYRLKVTSYKRGETGTYTLITKTPSKILPGSYSEEFGYGLVNAAAAVARAINQPAYAEVANLGGFNAGLDLIKAPEAWAQGYSGQGITVAVLDTGVDYNHTDLKDNIWTNPGEIAGNGVDDDNNGFVDDIHGWNFVDGSTNDPIDFDSHGTHVSGTIAAVNNGFGVTGVAYSAKIMPVKVIGGNDDNNLDTFDANVAQGIGYAIHNGARVINLSLGISSRDLSMPQTRTAIAEAERAGVVVVMAAGNEREEGDTQPGYPALYAVSNLGIAVGTVNNSRQIASFSNPAGNRPLDYVVAPGVNVRSTVSGGVYESQGWSGTSMSTAYVSGVAALILSANPGLSADQVETILAATANPNGIKVL